MSELTREHLETFVFDPHRASEPNIAAMARELIDARARLAELPKSAPVGYAVVHTSPGAPRLQISSVLTLSEAIDRLKVFRGGGFRSSGDRVVELREVNTHAE